jgi:hypothetical protein
MVEVVQRALALSAVLCPDAQWLFPARSSKDKCTVIAVQVWREETLPSKIGHILRLTYRAIAQCIGLDMIDARLLLDHTVPDIDGVFLHEKALFDHLLKAQEEKSLAIRGLL